MDSLTNSVDVNKLMKVLNLVAKIILENGGETHERKTLSPGLLKAMVLMKPKGLLCLWGSLSPFLKMD